MFDPAGKQVAPPADVLLLIKSDFNLPAAHEADAILRNNTREVALALQLQQASNLFFVKRGLAKVVKAKDFRQRILPFLHQRQVVQRQMRDEAPEDTFASGRAHRGRWLP